MTDPPQITPGERFTSDVEDWDHRRLQPPHIWHTLGYRRLAWEPGSTTLAWEASEDYCFPAAGGAIVQGGLVTALLDGAMGGSCWTVLDNDQAFLTADLRVEFLRSAHPGTIVARGWVVRRTRRVVFCAGELYDGSVEGALLATSRCTQVVLPAVGRAGRYEDSSEPAGRDGPPRDGRG